MAQVVLVTRVSRRRERRRHPGRWLLGVLLVLAALAGALQYYGPRLAATEIASAVAPTLGARPEVTVSAPVWMLAQGAFTDVHAQARGVPTPDIRLARAALDWRMGQVSLPQALRGRLRVLRLGSLTASLEVDEASLQSALDRALRGKLPNGVRASAPLVRVLPGGIAFSGKVTIAGLPLPYRLVGSLMAISGGQSIAFLPQSFEGARLRVGPLTILQLSHVISRSPFRWRISSIRLETGRVLVYLRAIGLAP